VTLAGAAKTMETDTVHRSLNNQMDAPNCFRLGSSGRSADGMLDGSHRVECGR